MTVIITGGAGFIGSNYIFYHMAAHPEDRVICLDKLTYAGNLSTLEPVLNDSRFRVIESNLLRVSLVFQLGTVQSAKPISFFNHCSFWNNL